MRPVDQMPAWSPDSSRIAFMSTRAGNAEIYTMNADGTVQQNITSNTAVDGRPSWSKNGTQIAFMSMRDGNLDYSMRGSTSARARRSLNRTATIAPDAMVITPTTPIAVATPNASATIPATNAPATYPRSRQRR